MNEFQLIAKYFNTKKLTNNSIANIGDDCAVFNIPANTDIVQSIDTLVAGVHFPESFNAAALGYRSLAVCVSDLAAMGAKPHSFLLALTLPKITNKWLEDFCSGLAKCAQANNIALVGGDLTKGPLHISIHCQGLLTKNSALLRSGANAGDLIYVTGNLGDARGALNYLNKEIPNNNQKADINKLLTSYWYPASQINIAQELKELGATSAIDISDGLLQDLSHILVASNVGARINLTSIPLSQHLLNLFTLNEAKQFALSGGDDYMLVVTIPSNKEQQIIKLQNKYPNLQKIGVITDEALTLTDKQNNILEPTGYIHKW